MARTPDQKAFLEAFLDACEDGELAKAQEAIASGRLTVEDIDEGLAVATPKSHSDIVAALFAAGARVCPDRADLRDPGIARQFLDHGLDPNARCSNGFPLLCFLSDPACVRELLLRGADPNISDPRGGTPLRYAMGHDGEEDEWKPRVELLLEYGAKLEPDLLFVAAHRSKLPELRTKYLLAKGLDPNCTSPEWGTPLHQAVDSSRPAVVKLLLEAGADPTIRAPATARYPGETPAEIAASKIKCGRNPDIMRAMLDILQSGGSVAR